MSMEDDIKKLSCCGILYQLLHLKNLATKNKPQRELMEREPIELNLHKFSWAQRVD